jgi:hypothetical protein
MSGQAGEAHQPEALAGRVPQGAAAAVQPCLPGAGGRGMTRRSRPAHTADVDSSRAGGAPRGVPVLCMSSPIRLVGRRDCTGCWLSHKGAEHAAPSARIPCAALSARSPRSAVPRRAGQHRAGTGNRPGAARYAAQARRALCRAAQGRRAAPRENETVGGEKTGGA